MILPANVMMLNKILLNVAMYDVVSEDGICSTCEVKNYFYFDDETN
jgi:hypothetical protein